MVQIITEERNPLGAVGEAYAFFDCRASQEEIEGEIPTIRRLTLMPSSLELHLMEGTDSLKGDPELRQIAGNSDRKYVMKAIYPAGTNREAADKLAGMLNQAYQSPLYQKGEPLGGKIIYKERGEYKKEER